MPAIMPAIHTAIMPPVVPAIHSAVGATIHTGGTASSRSVSLAVLICRVTASLIALIIPWSSHGHGCERQNEQNPQEHFLHNTLHFLSKRLSAFLQAKRDLKAAVRSASSPFTARDQN
jgi:hypothetical protein